MGSPYPQESVYEPAPSRNMPGREDSFGSQGSDRRRRERLHPEDVGTLQNPSRTSQHPTGDPTAHRKGASRPWDEPHVINPRPGETVVVTETYTYRPKRASFAEPELHGRESCRSSEYNNREHGSNRLKGDRPRATDEDYAYYKDDWSKEDPLHNRDEPARGRPSHQRYTVTSPQSESRDSSAQYRRACR